MVGLKYTTYPFEKYDKMVIILVYCTKLLYSLYTAYILLMLSKSVRPGRSLAILSHKHITILIVETSKQICRVLVSQAIGGLHLHLVPGSATVVVSRRWLRRVGGGDTRWLGLEMVSGGG